MAKKVTFVTSKKAPTKVVATATRLVATPTVRLVPVVATEGRHALLVATATQAPVAVAVAVPITTLRPGPRRLATIPEAAS